MDPIRSSRSTLLLAACLAACSLAWGQTGKYRYAETTQLVDLVNDAAAMVRQNGEDAFRTLMKKGSRWRSGELYVFVIDLKGLCFVHEDTSLIGKNICE